MSRGRRLSLGLLVGFYMVAGLFHVLKPAPFLRVMPGWVPSPHAVIVVTGLCELAGALALLVPPLRRLAGVMLALYAVCVFPANIKHMLDFAHDPAPLAGWLYHGPRMLAQPLIVWWSLYASGVTDWPWRSQRQP